MGSRSSSEAVEEAVRAEGAERPELAARICWYHHREGQTQQQIADRVGLSRVTVNRILRGATERGLVRISLDSTLIPYLELEEGLRRAYHLEAAVVVPAPADPDEIRTSIGYAVGDYVSRNLAPREVLGLGWGGTVYAASRALEPRKGAGNVVVSLSGGLARSTVINPYDNAAMFARILDAECYYLTAPMVVDSRRTRDALMASEPIASVLAIARRIDLALLTASDLSGRTWLIRHGVITPEIRRSLVEAGAVGSVAEHYLDAAGRPVAHWLNERTIRLPLDVVRAAPRRVLAAGGRFKLPIITTVLRTGLPNVLITDDATARELLGGAVIGAGHSPVDSHW